MNPFAVDAEFLIAVAIPEQVVTSSLSPIIEIHTAGLNDLPYPPVHRHALGSML
ncbi:hypothetical protein AAA573_14735 [Pseudomonas aeruginosa]|nr:hypothetical protein [Pseudomonas aeruginosa]